MTQSINEILTAGTLASLPLLFCKGQTAHHSEYGMVEIIDAKGATDRLICVRRNLAREVEMWVDISELSDFEMQQVATLSDPDLYKTYLAGMSKEERADHVLNCKLRDEEAEQDRLEKLGD